MKRKVRYAIGITVTLILTLELVPEVFAKPGPHEDHGITGN
jgi:hypothetical protein